MDRRTFINRVCLTAGAVSVPTWGWTQEVGYDGPFLVHVEAGGGWDTTLMCDPKGRLHADEANPTNRTYHRDDIRSPNAPSPLTWAPTQYNDTFFGRYYDRLLVLNGIDLGTVNHATGRRYMGSGAVRFNTPSLGALLAASLAPTLGLTYWSAGGYDVTDSLVVRSRVANADGLADLTTPNQFPTHFNEELLYQPEGDFNLAMGLVRARAQRRAAASRLPQLQEGLRNYARSHSPGQGLDQMRQFLPDLNGLQSSVARQVALALAGYQAGLTCAMSAGGPWSFDTHSDNDDQSAAALTLFYSAIDEAWRYIEDQGMADRTLLLMTSELGRTPAYNSGEGKDHWPITTAMLMGTGIRGNRVIGGSTHAQQGRLVNPATLEVVDDEAVGLALTPQQVHLELRDLLGLTGLPLTEKYPIDAPRIRFL